MWSSQVPAYFLFWIHDLAEVFSSLSTRSLPFWHSGVLVFTHRDVLLFIFYFIWLPFNVLHRGSAFALSRSKTLPSEPCIQKWACEILHKGASGSTDTCRPSQTQCSFHCIGS